VTFEITIRDQVPRSLMSVTLHEKHHGVFSFSFLQNVRVMKERIQKLWELHIYTTRISMQRYSRRSSTILQTGSTATSDRHAITGESSRNTDNAYWSTLDSDLFYSLLGSYLTDQSFPMCCTLTIDGQGSSASRTQWGTTFSDHCHESPNVYTSSEPGKTGI
jgi:hypothetical protein